jgi:hypothetical protein
MSKASAQNLCEQFMDFCAQPSTVESLVSKTADNNAILSQALSSLTGQQNDIALGGAPADHNWHSLKCITFCDSKIHAVVEDFLKDLQDGQYLVQTTTKNNITSIVIKVGYDLLAAREWTSQSYLYQMSVQGLEFYIQLYQCTLTLILNNEGNFNQLKAKIEHHSKLYEPFVPHMEHGPKFFLHPMPTSTTKLPLDFSQPSYENMFSMPKPSSLPNRQIFSNQSS